MFLLTVAHTKENELSLDKMSVYIENKVDQISLVIHTNDPPRNNMGRHVVLFNEIT